MDRDQSTRTRAKRVFVIANSTWYLFNFRRELIKAMINSGYEVVAFAPEDSYVPQLQTLGTRFIPLKMLPRSVNPLAELVALINLFRVIRTECPDVVCSFTVKCNLYCGLLRYFFYYQHIVNISGLGESFERKGLLSFVVGSLYRIVLRKTDRIFFQNEEDLCHCVQKGLVRPSRAERIFGSGVNLERFKPRSQEVGLLESDRAPQSGRATTDKRTFLMFGRLIPKKGYDLFLEAARLLVPKYGERIELLVMGIPDKHRPESQRLEERLLAAERDGLVKCIPPCDEVEHVLAEVDCVVLPSEYNEGVPRSLLEALASGKIIVTTDWKGCRDTVEDGANGYLVAVGKATQLAQAMERVMNLSSADLAKFALRSRAIAEERFDERKVVSRYLREIELR